MGGEGGVGAPVTVNMLVEILLVVVYNVEIIVWYSVVATV